MSYFWNGYVLHNFLFKGLDTTSIPGLVGICVGILSVALLYEGLRSLKSILLQKYSGNDISIKGSSNTSRAARKNSDSGGEVLPSGAPEPTNSESLVQTHHEVNKERLYFNNRIVDKILHLFTASLFHGVYVFLGFSLMNAVMTFNIYVFLSAILGIGLGYFFFYDCSRLKIPYGIPKSDLTQCQALLSQEANEDNTGVLENNGQSSTQRDTARENQLIVQAEIYNVE